MDSNSWHLQSWTDSLKLKGIYVIQLVWCSTRHYGSATISSQPKTKQFVGLKLYNLVVRAGKFGGLKEHKIHGKKYGELKEAETEGKDKMKGSDTPLRTSHSTLVGWDAKRDNYWSKERTS